MGKKSARFAAKQQRTLRHGIHIELIMECQDEVLAPCQVEAFRKADKEYKDAMSKIREAHRLEKEGLAIVQTMPRHGMPIPPVVLPATYAPPVPKQVPPPVVVQPPQRVQPQRTQPPRPESPDLIIVGETPPPPKKPPQSQPQKQTPTQLQNQQLQNQLSRVLTQTNVVQNTVPQNAVPQQVYKFVNIPGQKTPVFAQQQNPHLIGVMRPVAPVQPQQQAVTRPPNLVRMQFVPTRKTTPVKDNYQSNEVVLGTQGLGIKRVTEVDLGPAKKKKKLVETDASGNWVPLDEYYYGKKEGDPTYTEEKGEYRFKCWYCSKMLYNNVKAMMHLQGHIDSGRQHNLDLTDLTQCKHCYKQFDTPFEMQTHVEKVHMSNTNVLMCRICERDLDSRQSLTTHMRQNHNACEMPYNCQLCNFRSSMYSDVVDHFKKKHDNSQSILCLYCLRIFKVKFVSQGWGQTQTYYGHLLKHQSKTSAKKCNLCRLTFFNPADVKLHKRKDHVPNQKGVLGLNKHSSPGQLMIKVPESGLHAKQQNLKSLNAPAVSKVLDFGGTRLPMLVNYLTCLECKTSMGTPDHYKKHIECTMCRFATSCSIAYANHMMGFHSGQMSSLNLNIPWERKMREHLYCLCGFGSRYGNNIANHLVYCAKRTCYVQKPDIVTDDGAGDEDVDPRHKPGASILDVLGLVKKRTVTTKESVDKDAETEKASEIRRRARDASPPPKSPPPSVRRKPRDITPPPKSPIEEQEENIPEELKGAQKWNTVKIKDTKEPSKTSVFLGVNDESKEETAVEGKQDEEADPTDKAEESKTSDENIDEKLAENKSEKCDEEQKMEDSLLGRTEDEPAGDDESKVNDSILDDDEDSSVLKGESEMEDKSIVEEKSKMEDDSKMEEESKIEDESKMEEESKMEDESEMEKESKMEDESKMQEESKMEDESKMEEESKMEDESKIEGESKIEKDSEMDDTSAVTKDNKADESGTDNVIIDKKENVSEESDSKMEDSDTVAIDTKNSDDSANIDRNDSGQEQIADMETELLDTVVEGDSSNNYDTKKSTDESLLADESNENSSDLKNDELENSEKVEDKIQNEKSSDDHQKDDVANTDDSELVDEEQDDDENIETVDKELESANPELQEQKTDIERTDPGSETAPEETEPGSESWSEEAEPAPEVLSKGAEPELEESDSVETSSEKIKDSSKPSLVETDTDGSSKNKELISEQTDSKSVSVDDNKTGENVKEIDEGGDSLSKPVDETKKSSSPEKSYNRDRSKSKETSYEERRDYGSHSSYHDDRRHGDRSHDRRQDYNRSSDNYRHGDRSHDHGRSHDHHRDRDHYRDRDRYHDNRGYQGHYDDRSYNKYGGGYQGNQRRDDRRDDYHNRNRGNDRYNQGGRGNYGYNRGGYRGNYR